MSLIEEITVENLDHLGIVAGLIDEVGIVEVINQKLGVDNREKITAGQVIKDLIYNNIKTTENHQKNNINYKGIFPRLSARFKTMCIKFNSK